MTMRYKPGVNVLEMLKSAGYSTYRLRQEKLLGERAIQKLRDGTLPSWGELEILCRVLQCQPWDLIEYQKTDD